MRGLCAIAGLMAALAFGAAPALAFQETPVPPAEAPQAAPQQQQAPAMQLGTPDTAPASSDAGQGGLKLFGYTFLPKLDFGLTCSMAKTSSNCSCSKVRARSMRMATSLSSARSSAASRRALPTARKLAAMSLSLAPLQ
jgi:hypothetical protein